MPKPELEFFRPDHLPWEPVAASPTGGAGGPGVRQRILSRDPATGDVTRLLQFDAGVETTEGMLHGPYRVPKRCMTLEIRYGRT